MLDGGQSWYRVYRTSDDKWLAVGAIEPQSWSELLLKLGIPEAETARKDPRTWPALGERLAAAICSKTRDEWEKIFDGSDACAAPVRSMTEAPHDPHLIARETFVEGEASFSPLPHHASAAPRAQSRGPPQHPFATPPTCCGIGSRSDRAAVRAVALDSRVMDQSMWLMSALRVLGACTSSDPCGSDGPSGAVGPLAAASAARQSTW